MGGLLAVDAATEILKMNLNDVRIRGILAVDSPFFGLNPQIYEQETQKVTRTATQISTTLFGSGKETTTVQTTTSTTTSKGFPSTTLMGGLFAVAAVAGLAVASTSPTIRSFVVDKASTAARHFEFLGPLWAIEGQLERMEEIERLRTTGLIFRALYLKLSKDQTFISLPPNPYNSYFKSIIFTGIEPVESHKHMFDLNRNPASYRDILRETSDFCIEVNAKSEASSYNFW